MKSQLARVLRGSILFLCLTPLVAFSQTKPAAEAGQTAKPTVEKFPMRLLPKPNTASRFTMTQENDLEMTFVGEVSEVLAAMNPMRMQSKSNVEILQKNGAMNASGQITSDVVYEKFDTEMTLNGTATPVPAGANQLVGKKVSIVYNNRGELVDVTIPDGLGIPAESFKQMMKSMFGNLPTEPMSIGETATLPLSLALPIPLPGAGQINMDGQVKLKLTAVNKEGADRIATFAQMIEAKVVNTMEAPGPDGATIKMSLDFKTSGDGQLQLNLDQGLVKSNYTTTTIEGRLTSTDKASAMPGTTLKGVTKVSIIGSQ